MMISNFFKLKTKINLKKKSFCGSMFATLNFDEIISRVIKSRSVEIILKAQGKCKYHKGTVIFVPFHCRL